MSAAKWAGTGNTISALALRLGLITLDQVNHVLDYLSNNQELFGQIAVNLGYLEEAHIDKLIQLQKMHYLVEVAEIYYIHTKLPLKELINETMQFYWMRAAEPAVALQ